MSGEAGESLGWGLAPLSRGSKPEAAVTQRGGRKGREGTELGPAKGLEGPPSLMLVRCWPLGSRYKTTVDFKFWSLETGSPGMVLQDCLPRWLEAESPSLVDCILLFSRYFVSPPCCVAD